MLTKMKYNEDGVFITKDKKFKPLHSFKEKTLETTLKFAYDMTFGKNGEHRNHRTGGTHLRKNGEIFANTFQGKLSEFAVYNTLYKDFPNLNTPDTETYGLGEWDNADFEVNNKKISVKSTKSFGNLLLLETKDWNNKGEYIPNINKGCAFYDYFILVRVNPHCEDLLKKNKILYSQNLDYNVLINILLNEKKWEYDIPGFITGEQLIYAINNNFVINKGDMLNGKTKMDAQNYYIQSGDMEDISQLKRFFNFRYID